MRIGIPKEIKDHEYRVGMIPAGVHTLAADGHEVVVQAGAGAGSGFSDQQYAEAGARVIDDVDRVWAEAEMIIKVKEPVEPEYPRMQRGQLLFTYLHLAPLPELTDALLEREVAGVAYETITDSEGRLPLLTPMSEVAGRMSVVVGASYLQKTHGGRGTLLAGIPGVPPGDVVIIGGGIVGINALKMALGLGASVTVLETNLDRMRYIDDMFQGQVITVASNHHNLLAAIRRADLLIGAVLIPGRAAPKLVSRAMIGQMKEGSVVVDVAVDQGGCFETTRATTHSDPVYTVDGVVHYCVANMPGAVPRTSTFGLTNATLPYARALARKGLKAAALEDPGLLEGINTLQGHVTSKPVADSLGRPYKPAAELL
ncbi:MAG TPA: alanine dehydrogenase [Thermoanaerobaculia bacterium]|nr:alanine dehydrogenase [Thermoanaerobaculia bacterium]